MKRRTFISGIGASIAVTPGLALRPARAAGVVNANLTKVNPKFMVTPQEVRAWHAAKDSKGGPTMTVSPSWRNYMQILEKGLHDSKCEDIIRNSWKFTRWYTTEFPDDSNWSLHIGDKKIRVASYGCNSGKTPEQGVRGEMVVYREGMPADALKGKIAIVVKERGAGGSRGTDDYEYLSNPETFPDPLKPRSEEAALSPFPIMGLGPAEAVLTKAGAIGALIVMPLSYDALSGVYTFGVPRLHDMPSLYLDRDTAAEVIDAAKSGKTATLRLISKTEEAEAYQLYGYLPGKYYESPQDQRVMLVTHTDGPSISQENGGLGILAMVKYFSHIPQDERPRTLMVRYDCRHYMPGAERAFAAEDYPAREPDAHKDVIAAMGIEHLGQIQVAEGSGQPYHRTNAAEFSSVWVTNNQHLVDMAIRAVKDNKLKRAQVQCPGRKGIHGGEQGPWYGLGSIARTLGVPGISTMGSMTGYWSTKARMDYLDTAHFVNQVATMCQLCGELMTADVSSIRSADAKAG